MKKNIHYLAGLLLLCTATQVYSINRVIVTFASTIERRDVVSGQPNSKVSWLAISDNMGYPSVTDPYSAGYMLYGPLSDGTETVDGSALHFKYISSELSVGINPGDTWESLAVRFANKYGQSGSKSYSSYTGGATSVFTFKDTCMGVAKRSGVNYESTVAADPQTCSKTQQATNPVTCDINASTNINHGVMAISSINGTETTINGNVSCSGNAKISFRMLNQEVSLGHGVTSLLKINNSSSPSEMNIIKSIPSNITITSVLSATNPTAGQLSGNSVVIVDVN